MTVLFDVHYVSSRQHNMTSLFYLWYVNQYSAKSAEVKYCTAKFSQLALEDSFLELLCALYFGGTPKYSKRSYQLPCTRVTSEYSQPKTTSQLLQLAATDDANLWESSCVCLWLDNKCQVCPPLFKVSTFSTKAYHNYLNMPIYLLYSEPHTTHKQLQFDNKLVNQTNNSFMKIRNKARHLAVRIATTMLEV